MFFYLGGLDGIASTPSAMYLSTPAEGVILSSLSTGDVNGDGYADVVAGAQGPLQQVGSINVILGSAAGPKVDAPIVRASPNGTRDNFGSTVAAGIDVNADGFNDVLVGAPSEMNGLGAAYVYLGSASGLSTQPAVSIVGVADPDYAAPKLVAADAGDVNGDGYSDVVIRTGRYLTWVYEGGPSGLGSSPAVTIPSPDGYNLNSHGKTLYESGAPPTGIGDVNGDGYGDLLLPATHYDSTTLQYFADFFLYPGGPTGTATTPALHYTYEHHSDIDGVAHAIRGGDFNGDQIDDVPVGFSDTLSCPEVRVFAGSTSGLTTDSPLQTLTNPMSQCEAGFARALAYVGTVRHEQRRGMPTVNTSVSRVRMERAQQREQDVVASAWGGHGSSCRRGGVSARTEGSRVTPHPGARCAPRS